MRAEVSEKSDSGAGFDVGSSGDAEMSPKICDAIEARLPRLLPARKFESEDWSCNFEVGAEMSPLPVSKLEADACSCKFEAGVCGTLVDNWSSGTLMTLTRLMTDLIDVIARSVAVSVV
jgi:hypothetical protein